MSMVPNVLFMFKSILFVKEVGTYYFQIDLSIFYERNSRKFFSKILPSFSLSLCKITTRDSYCWHNFATRTSLLHAGNVQIFPIFSKAAAAGGAQPVIYNRCREVRIISFRLHLGDANYKRSRVYPYARASKVPNSN